MMWLLILQYSFHYVSLLVAFRFLKKILSLKLSFKIYNIYLLHTHNTTESQSY